MTKAGAKIYMSDWKNGGPDAPPICVSICDLKQASFFGGGTWWYMILGHTHLGCSHWTAARVPPRSILVLVTWRCMWGRSQPNTHCQPSLNDATPAANSETLGFPTPVSFKASFVSKDQDAGYKWKQQWAHLRNQLTFQYIHSFPMLGVQRQLLKICQPWGASHETRPLQPHRTASSPPLSCGKSRLKYFRTQIYTYTYIHI